MRTIITEELDSSHYGFANDSELDKAMKYKWWKLALGWLIACILAIVAMVDANYNVVENNSTSLIYSLIIGYTDLIELIFLEKSSGVIYGLFCMCLPIHAFFIVLHVKLNKPRKRALKYSQGIRNVIEKNEIIEKNYQSIIDKSHNLSDNLEPQICALKQDIHKSFSRRSFSRFWEQVAIFKNTMNQSNTALKDLNDSFTIYVSDLESIEHTFPIPRVQMSSAQASFDKINSALRDVSLLIEQASCDFEFSSIFEQRRTTDAVNATATQIAQQLSDMQSTLSAQLHILNQTTEAGLNKISAKIVDGNQSIANAFDRAYYKP